MVDALLDSTVVIHLLRRYQPAVDWLDTAQTYAVSSVTWLEIMEGTTSKRNQSYSRNMLKQFMVIYLAESDQKWAMQQLETYQFSHHIGMNDCLIAAVAYRLQKPLYTHNLKDMIPLIGELAQKPYG